MIKKIKTGEIIGYSPSGEPQVLELNGCPAGYNSLWQVLICANSPHERATMLHQLLDSAVYIDMANNFHTKIQNKIFVSCKESVEKILNGFMAEISARYDEMDEFAKGENSEVYAANFPKLLAKNGKEMVVLIIDEPSSWQPDFYSINEKLLLKILRQCGRVNARVVIIDDYSNIPPLIRASIATTLAKFAWFEDLGDKLKDRVRGMLVGLAIGDALGANLEFTIFHHEDITDNKVAMSDGMYPKGAWTDDTSMALCLGNSLLECNGYDSYDVMTKYQNWYEDGYCSFDGKPAGDIGLQVASAVKRFKDNPVIDEYDKRSDRAGNGTIMRLAPVVISTVNSPIQETIKLAQVSARETHYSWEAEAGAEIFAAMLRQAMELENKEVIIHVEEFSTGAVYDDILERVLSSSKMECKHNLEDLGGYVVDALAIAAWGFRNFDTFESGMRAVIKLGGDTDTNGAIYGQLAGAYYGYNAIPKNWKKDLLREEEIKNLADKLLAMRKCPILKTRFIEDGDNVQ